LTTTLFTNYATKGVGTTAAAVITPDATAGAQTTLTGMSCANTTNLPVTASVFITRGGQDYYIVKGATVPAGGTMTVAGWDQKIVLQAGDVVKAQSSTATSIDIIAAALVVNGSAGSGGGVVGGGGGGPPTFSLSTPTVISGSPSYTMTNPNLATNGTNLFVAVAGNSFATSANGTTWSAWSTLNSTIPDSAWTVHYVNGQFVAMGQDPFGGTPGFYISVFNGTSWGTPSQMNSTSSAFYASIAHNGSNLYIAVGTNNSTGNPAYATSSNLTTWSAPTAFPGGDIIYAGMNKIIYQGSSFVTIGYNGYYYVRPNSTGLWSSAAQIPSGGGSSEFKDLAYSASLGLYVAVGYNYQGSPNPGARPVITTSANGTTWTAMTTLSALRGDLDSIAFGNGRFLAVGINQDGDINKPLYFTSTDGVNWTRTALNPTSQGRLFSTGYGASKFVAVGQEFTGGQVTVAYS
jgi:hypothetical protein